MLVGLALLAQPVLGEELPRIVHFASHDGGRLEAGYFEAGKGLGVVFAHGAVFDKSSWYPLAWRLKRLGITSLSIDFRGYGASRGGRGGGLADDVLGAVTYLEQQGARRIALVGGSMGAAAVLGALQRSGDPRIRVVVLLAPAGGAPLQYPKLRKLFVVSEGDTYRAAVQRLYQDSAPPKTLDLIPGSAHAQHLFSTSQGPALTQRIVDFLRASRPAPAARIP